MIPYTTVVSFSLSINSSSFLQPYDTATAAEAMLSFKQLPTSQSRKYCIAQCFFCQSNSLLLFYQMYMDSVALYPNLPKYSALKSSFVSSRRNNRSVSVIIKSTLIILLFIYVKVNKNQRELLG
mgnify:CR=1 FL=1